jgi:hypothetical protein
MVEAENDDLSPQSKPTDFASGKVERNYSKITR